MEDELTIDTYVKGQLHQYIWMVGLSIGYLDILSCGMDGYKTS